jgi:hypothetical protein
VAFLLNLTSYNADKYRLSLNYIKVRRIVLSQLMAELRKGILKERRVLIYIYDYYAVD